MPSLFKPTLAAVSPGIALSRSATKTSILGTKGFGEAGIGSAPGAAMNAVNYALHQLGVEIFDMPMKPERLLRVLDVI